MKERKVIIILEGNECCFKTTYGKRLSEQFSINCSKGSDFKYAMLGQNQLYSYFYDLFISKLLEENDGFILDRFFVSNLVYASLFPIKNDKIVYLLTDAQKLTLTALLNEFDVITIHFHDTSENIINRLKNRKDEYFDESEIDKIENINRKYKEVFDNIKLKKVIDFNCATDTYNELVKKIEEVL